MANQAVLTGVFMFINLPGVADASYEALTLATWTNLLDHLKTLAGQYDLWVDILTTIVKYNRSRAPCGTTQVSGNTLIYTDPQAWSVLMSSA